jgi:hypothetical protein
MKRLSVHTHTPTYPPKHPPSPPKKLEIIKDIFLSSLEDYLHLTEEGHNIFLPERVFKAD